MSFTHNSFTLSKSWENSTDFPTYEDDESQVRADMQYLFDEINANLNTHISEDVAENIPFTPTESVSATTIAGAIEVLHQQVIQAEQGFVADNSISTEKLIDGAVTSAKIATSGVGTTNLADGAVTTAKMADGAVTSAKIADGTIENGDIKDATIMAAKIASGQVAKLDQYGKAGADAIASYVDTISADKTLAAADNKRFLRATAALTITIPVSALNSYNGYEVEVMNSYSGTGTISIVPATGVELYAAGESSPVAGYAIDKYEVVRLKRVNTDRWIIEGGAIMPAGVVGTLQLKDSAVTAAKIADSNVTTAKIADSNVTTDKLAASAVTTAKIADANVTTAKIADANVTTAKIADSSVTTAKIADANVTTDKLAAGAVTAAKIADANVTTAKIADGNVITDKLAASAVTTAKIADANVTTAKIADANVTVAKLAADVYSSSDPTMNGTASAGSASTLAKSDHVHPTDTSRAAQADMTTAQADILKITPAPISITLTAAPGDWASVATDVYSQSVTSLQNVTSKTKVDLTPDYTTVLQMVADGTYSIYISNSSGTLTAYAVGAAPSVSLTISGVRYETA